MKKGYLGGIGVSVFLSLKRKGFIEEQKTLRQNTHPIFHASHRNPVVVYVITDAGKEYLETTSNGLKSD